MPKINQDTPHESWSLLQLSTFIREKILALNSTEKATAKTTYCTGQALYFAREKLKQTGQWQKWLKRHQIPPVTAWEAIRLFESAKSETEIESLTTTKAKTKLGIYANKQNRQANEEENGSTQHSTRSGIDSAFQHLRLAAEDIYAIQDWSLDLILPSKIVGCLNLCRQIRRHITSQQSKRDSLKKASVKEQRSKDRRKDMQRAKLLKIGISHFRVLRSLKEAARQEGLSYREIEKRTGHYAVLPNVLHTNRTKSLCALGLVRKVYQETEESGTRVAFAISQKGENLLKQIK